MKEVDSSYIIKFSDSGVDGWAYGRPPGISSIQWPRSRVNGLPMAHLFTTRIPSKYIVNKFERCYLSVFEADDHVADEIAGVRQLLENEALEQKRGFFEGLLKKFLKRKKRKERLFWDVLQKYSENCHSKEIYLEDDIGGGWSLIYLTENEFKAGICDLPNKDGVPENYASTDGNSCFSSDKPARPFNLEEHNEDPNTGFNPEDWPDWLDEYTDEQIENIDDVSSIKIEGYIPIFHPLGEKMNLVRYFDDNHFGGTSHASQSIPDELSSFYLEFDESLGSPNLGGDGVAQIDLKNNKLFWACG